VTLKKKNSVTLVAYGAPLDPPVIDSSKSLSLSLSLSLACLLDIILHQSPGSWVRFPNERNRRTLC
jgi:hypothetical protein